MSNKPGNLDNIEVHNQNNFPPLLLFLNILQNSQIFQNGK